MREIEKSQWKRNELVLGIDEAGRGPLAGPCIVCGVVFPKNYENPEINDSKKISDKKRREILDQIKKDALYLEIIEVSPKMIDEHNIYQSTKNAMIDIAKKIDVSYVISDAMPFTVEGKIVNDVVKADQKSISVAAASIVAKTYRDDLMIEYDEVYPNYGFASHKGYGTKKHKEAILKYGRTPIHRSSFRFKDEDQISLDI